MFISTALHLGVALDAVVSAKGVFALAVAGTAGLAFFHVGHGRFGSANAVGEYLGVAVSAFIGLKVEIVAKGGLAGRLRDHVVDDAGFQAFVALGAVAGRGEDVLAVVAGAA